jgi:energy-coupling factor transport system substrate-specific component
MSSRLVMFSAVGTHGPVLSPIADFILDLLFVSFAFVLFSMSKPSKMQSVLFCVFVVVIVAGRILLQPLPNVQPVTLAVLLMGAHQGVQRGVSFALLVTLLSNLFIGDGWWTLFQALGWSAVAILGAGVASKSKEMLDFKMLLILSAISAILFDFITTFSLVNGSTTLTDFVSILYSGLMYDAFHILGNMSFAVWFGHTMQQFLLPLPEITEDIQLVEDVYVVRG